MAFCGNCGKEISDGVRFCSNCGASIGNEAPDNLAGSTSVDNTSVNAPDNTYVSRADMNPYMDPTRAYVIPPQTEPESTGIDKFGKFFWIPLVILTIVDFVSDPPIVTILLSAVIIGGAIYALARKCKFKGFAIVCIVLAAICMIAGVSQAKKYGLFTISGKSDYTSTADKDEEVSDAASEKDSTVQTSDSKPGSATTDSKFNDKNDKSDSTTTSDDNKASEPAESKDDSSASVATGGVDPDLKAFLNSYEEFVDEYVDFMKKYMANPTDLSLMGEYADMLSKLSDFDTKLDNYDSNNMSTEDAAYYLEVTTRCTQKMLEIL